jgi:hypothetical protein
MAKINCPNVGFPEFKKLVAEFGDEAAHIAFFRNGGEMPSIERAREILGVEEAPKFSKKDEEQVAEFDKKVAAAKPTEEHTGVVQKVLGKSMDIISRVKAIHKKMTDIGGSYSPFRKVLNEFSGGLQHGAFVADRAVYYIKGKIKEQPRRDAVSVWREAGGDNELLKMWAENTKDAILRKKYEIAQILTDAEKTLASEITKKYEQLYQRAYEYGLVGEARKNYVTHLIMGENKPEGYGSNLSGSGKLANTFKYGKEASFPTIFEAEQAGYHTATSDAADLMGLYISEMEKVINTHEMVRGMMNEKASDGRPLAVVEGEMGTELPLVSKSMQKMKINDRPQGDYSDYTGLTHYALHNWNQVGADLEGKIVYLKGDIAFHKEIYHHMRAILGPDLIKDWMNNPKSVYLAPVAWGLRKADATQAAVKQAMFSLSAFHWVQEGTHAVWHATNPFNVTSVNLNNPEHLEWANHSLMVYPDHKAMADFQEGLSSGGNVLKRLGAIGRKYSKKLGELEQEIPGVGKVMKETASENMSELLFKWYIPALKLKTAKHIFERNTELYKKELASGKVSRDDVMYLSAQQANAAYGHLNYMDMGRSKTMQHLIRMFALAPDFLEARARYSAQAAKVFIGGKNGVEQMNAMARNAIGLAGACAIINAILNNGDTHLMDEPFKIIYKNRAYHLRSVAGDWVHLIKRPRQFFLGRVSPIGGRLAVRAATNRDYRGQVQKAEDFIGELLTSGIPISYRSLVPGMSSNKDLNAWDSFLSASGIAVSRYSPMTKIYEMVDKWKEKNGIPATEPGTYPTSKFRDLRNYVQDGKEGKVKDEWERLSKETKTPPEELFRRFSQSTMRGFTGSAKGDESLYATLSGEDKKMFMVAKQDRIRLIKNLMKILNTKDTDVPPEYTEDNEPQKPQSGIPLGDVHPAQ